MTNEHSVYFNPTHLDKESNTESNDSNNNNIRSRESVENINFSESTGESLPPDDIKNPILDKMNICDTIDSPIRLNTSDQKPSGFSSLKTETFDNNFKDLHKLRRKHELLALSKRYLYSKLYTPKLEALQRLVEPGKYLINNGMDENQKSVSTNSFTNYNRTISTRIDDNNIESTTKTDDFDISYTYDFKSDLRLMSGNRNYSTDFNSNFDFLDLDKLDNEFVDVSFCDTDTSNKLHMDSFKEDYYKTETGESVSNVPSDNKVDDNENKVDKMNEYEYNKNKDNRDNNNNNYVDKYDKLIHRLYTKKLDESKKQTPNVLTLRSSQEYINGRKKKRVQIPVNAYKSTTQDGTIDKSHKIVLKLVGLDLESEYKSKNIFDIIEDKLERIVKNTELYGDKIINPENIINELESIRPQNIDKEQFLFMCMKPIGMSYTEYFKCFKDNNINEFINQLHNFNLININAMGYVLDAEYEILKEFNRLGRIHQKLINEDIIYSKILATMQENFMSQAEDLLKTTRQDLRLEVGYSHLRWGRIKNVLSWKQGDTILREKGFAQDMASTNKMKTLQRMEQAFGPTTTSSPYSPSTETPINEALYMYYIKTLQNLEEREQEVLQLQVSRDRMQTLSEFSLIGPHEKPANSLPWKCIGLSCNSVVWKMYNTVECLPIVYKFRSLKDVDTNIERNLEILYNKALERIRELNLRFPKRSQVVFSNSVQVRNKCVVEQMQFIKHTPFSLILEKSTQFNSNERFVQTQVVLREVVRMVNHMKNLNFILPLKSSRIYFNNGGVILSGGVPLSLIGEEGVKLLKKHSVQTIATLLWGKNIEWYLPPEAKGNPCYTNDPLLISKAHTWMVGKILYESICVSTVNKNELDYSRIEMCENEVAKEFMKSCLEKDINKRPKIDEVQLMGYLKKVKLNCGSLMTVDVPKVRCAVEFLGDIETIVLNKIRKTEKGVADYEQYDESEMKYYEDENLGILNYNDKYFYHRNIVNNL